MPLPNFSDTKQGRSSKNGLNYYQIVSVPIFDLESRFATNNREATPSKTLIGVNSYPLAVSISRFGFYHYSKRHYFSTLASTQVSGIKLTAVEQPAIDKV